MVALEDEWNKYVGDLNNIVSSYSIEEIEESISKANELKDFFNEIPLVRLAILIGRGSTI
ncbi:hypothetical protein CN584_13715 [Bacillus pseudomycoides]|nr:hypothetical protein CN584_13715 [Bacillus pseudomycoides]